MQYTFLKAFRPLAKVYNADNTVTSYPSAKRLTSESIFAQSLEQRVSVIKEQAEQGHALLKGHLTRKIEQESRAGLTDQDAPTENIIIDIDGYMLTDNTLPESPRTRADLQRIAEHIILLLPVEFHNCSYIVHASASMGTRRNTASLHLEFLLDRPTRPTQLKTFLQYLNLKTQAFASQLELTASGLALKYTIDPSVADNSRIIFIAPPVFENADNNPIPNPEDRIFGVPKDRPALTIQPVLDEITPASVRKAATAAVRELREIKGLPEVKPKYHSFASDAGERTQYVTNPDRIKMELAYDNGDWVYYNIDGGDSNAYYVKKYDPYLVYNFKGEDPFVFKIACPAAYEEHLATFIRNQDGIEDKVTLEPIVFNTSDTNEYYRGLYNPVSNELVEVHKCDRAGINDWLVQHKRTPVDNIEVWDMQFAPRDPRTVDLENRFVNTFKAPRIITNPVEIPQHLQGLTPETAFSMEVMCPTIFKVLRSVTGDGDTELTHFLNWLAFILQTREKPGTAWVLHGRTGTGKGMLFNLVLAPLFNPDITESKPDALTAQFAQSVRTETLDEQYNEWLKQALLVLVDEYQESDAKKKSAIAAKIRNYITEPTTSIRAMRTGARPYVSYTAFIFTSNKHDVMAVTPDDRRLNVCPRQEISLAQKHPEAKTRFPTLIKEELPMFAALLIDFAYNEDAARTALDNNAKQAMRRASQNMNDDFLEAIRTGDLPFFIELLETENPDSITSHLPAAQNVVKYILSGIDSKGRDQLERDNVATVGIGAEQIRLLYNACMPSARGMSAHAFAKTMKRAGLIVNEARPYVGGRQTKGKYIDWNLGDLDLDELVETYLTDNVFQAKSA